MRYFFQIFVALASFISNYGFVPVQQSSTATITILNHEDQPVTQIIDGDAIKIQIALSQPVTQDAKISFSLEDGSLVGSCVVASGQSACATESFFALGWRWDANHVAPNARVIQATNGGNDIVATSNPIAIQARPVVMVHGFISNADTWKPYVSSDGFLASLGLSGFAVGDGQVPGKLNTGDMLSPVGRTNTIAQNAEILGQYIHAVKQKTGAQMVDLVVHSMGGMISRYYIDRVMKDRDVAQLIMLGSPMGGSDCAVLPAALGFYLPASIEIRESYMRGVFNQQITRRHGIEFYDLAGTAILEPFKSPCTGVPNDTVVGFDSVNAIVLQSSQIETIHSNLTLSDKAFQDFVKPLLTKPAGMFPLRALPDPDPVSQTDSPLDFTRVYTGHVDAGGATDLAINVDAGLSVASFALYDASRSITTIVRGASGNVIQLSSEANGFIQIDDPSSLYYLGYGFENPRPGPWNITVQATDKTPSTGADFAISVYFVGGAKLEATSNTLVPQIKDRVRFEARLLLAGQPLEITQAQALIKDSNGNVETLDFPAGQAISVEWIPQQAGTYAVDIVVTGRAPDGLLVERTDFLAVEVQTNQSKGQITFNLMAVIAIVLVAVFLVLRVVFRGAGRLFRRTS